MKSVVFGSQAPGLNDTAIAKAVDDRHRRWSEQLPREPATSGTRCSHFDTDSRDALFAHCVALSINAVLRALELASARAGPRRSHRRGRRPRHCGGRLVANGRQLSRPSDQGPHSVEAVREAKGEQAAQLIDHLKKGEMAERAQELLAGSGWLPEPLRTPGRAIGATASLSRSRPDVSGRFVEEEFGGDRIRNGHGRF